MKKDKIIKRIKVKIKDCNLIAKVKISTDYVINNSQWDLLSQKYTNGFLKLSKSKKNKLEFVGLKGVSLYERFKSPISEYDFFFIMEQIVNVIQKLEKLGLSRNNLVLDLKYVFFSEATKEVSFMYLPIATPHGNISILSFIEQIIYSIKPVESDTDYLSSFNCFIKKFKQFDADKVELYIYEIDSNIVNVIKKEKVKRGSCESEYGKSINKQVDIKIFDDELTDIMPDDEKTDLMSGGNEPTDFSSATPSRKNWTSRKESTFDVNDNEITDLLDEDATEFFLDNEEKTDIFEEIQTVTYKYPMLIRTLTEEIIRINKPVFRIGTEEGCVDYIVSNNVTISRSHVDIISRGEKYYIFDLRSKNKSYINNRVLPTEYEVEIFNGDVLKLANEEFLFRV